MSKTDYTDTVFRHQVEPYIAHCTTVHQRNDTRIFLKECASLARNDINTVLYVADGKGDENDEASGVFIKDIGSAPLPGRLFRILLQPIRMFAVLLRDLPRLKVVHFHDPELMFLGVLLKAFGCKVVYDVHEDVPSQVHSKHWVPRLFRKPLSKVVAAVEWITSYFYDAIVVVTPTIGKRFPKSKTVLVRNFPMLSEFTLSDSVPYEDRPPTICFVGGITRMRGAREMVESVSHVSRFDGFRFDLVGPIDEPGLRSELEQQKGWERVRAHGRVSRQDVARIMGNARAGLVLFLPAPNHIEAMPNKLFEYMAAGVPVIASDFPLWREIVEKSQCGLLVDPTRPEEIATAIVSILEKPELAKTMGERGRDSIVQFYNWDSEAKKLSALYENLLGHRSGQTASCDA